jgi:hypothetical protein
MRLWMIELAIVIGIFAVPVGRTYAIPDQWAEPKPPTFPTYLEPAP